MNTSNTGKNGESPSARLNKSNFSWALYDWANSAFATTIMAGFFPIFFKSYWSHDVSVSESTYYLGVGNSLASLFLAILAPYLGALADLSSKKKQYLSTFAFIGIIGTASLYFVGSGQWQWAVLFYTLAALGFAAGNVFYDSLLPTVAPKSHLDFISGFGFALGYLGGGLLFTINVAMTLKPEWFGLPDKVVAVKVSFLSVAIWWLVFTLPLLFFVREPSSSIPTSQQNLFISGFHRFLLTLKEFCSNKAFLIFLLAYFFYIDGVNTIIKMAVDYGMALGFESSHLITALLITQFVGFPSAVAFGYFGEKWSTIGGIFLALSAYVLITIYSYFMTTVSEFYIMAGCIGLVQGGVQSLSRSHFAKCVPDKKEAEYFGFFNMMGKASAILGPFLVGWVSLKTANPRLSILVIIGFLLLGGTFLFIHYRLLKKTIV